MIDVQEAITLTIDSLSHLTKDSYYARYSAFDEQSKVEKLLGSGEGSSLISTFYTLFVLYNLIA